MNKVLYIRRVPKTHVRTISHLQVLSLKAVSETSVNLCKSYEPEPVNTSFSYLYIFLTEHFCPQAPSQETEGPRSKSAAGLPLGLAAHTPIRTRPNDGTLNCLRSKGPILRDVIATGVTLHRPGSFLLSRQPKSYAGSLTLPILLTPHSLQTNSSLNSSPVTCIARIILNSLRATATIAIFLRAFCPHITR